MLLDYWPLFDEPTTETRRGSVLAPRRTRRRTPQHALRPLHGYGLSATVTTSTGTGYLRFAGSSATTTTSTFAYSLVPLPDDDDVLLLFAALTESDNA